MDCVAAVKSRTLSRKEKDYATIIDGYACPRSDYLKCTTMDVNIPVPPTNPLPAQPPAPPPSIPQPGHPPLSPGLSQTACVDVWPLDKCTKKKNKGQCGGGKMKNKCALTCGMLCAA